MYYTITTKIGESDISTVVAAEITNSKGRVWFNVKQFLSTPSLTDNVLLSSNEYCQYPYLICEDENACLDVTDLYKILDSQSFEPNEELLNQILVVLDGQLTKDDVLNLNRCFKEFNSYMEGNMVRILMEPAYYDNFRQTKMLVDNINSSGKADSIVVEGDNKTVVMSSPEDEFFIRVPSYDELIGNKLLPRFSGIYDPYKGTYLTDPEEIKQWERINERDYVPPLRTTRFKEFLNEERFKQLNSNITILDVTGDPKNNDLDLQPNELRYYNALRSLMDVAMQRENPDMDVESCLEAHQYSKVVEEYLNNISLMGLFQNWSHNGLVPYNLEDELTIAEVDEDDDDGEYKESSNSDNSDAEGKRSFSLDMFGNNEAFDGAALLSNIIEDICRQDPYYAIEFAIKLNRFGDRKPTRLSILGGRYLDLNTLTVSTSNGNLASLEIYEDEEGNNLFPISTIRFSDIMTDKQYKNAHFLQMDSITMDVGLICVRKFKDMEDKQLVCLSFIDIVEIYRSPKPVCKIKGIDLVDDKFVISQEIVDLVGDNYKSTREVTSLIKESTNMAICFLTYDDFKKAFFEEDVWNNNYSIISILDEFYSTRDLSSIGGYSYETKSQLRDLVSTGQALPYCIRANIFNKVIPLIDQVASFVEKLVINDEPFNFGTLISITDKVVASLGFIGSFGTAEDIEQSGKLSNFSKVSNSSSKEDDDEVISTKILQNDLNGYKMIRIILADAIYNELSKVFPKLRDLGDVVVDGTSSKIVGVIGMKSKDEYVLVNPDNAPEQFSSNVDALSLGVIFSTTIKRVAKDEEIKYKYDSKESAVYYANLMNNLIKVAFSKLR